MDRKVVSQLSNCLVSMMITLNIIQSKITQTVEDAKDDYLSYSPESSYPLEDQDIFLKSTLYSYNIQVKTYVSWVTSGLIFQL